MLTITAKCVDKHETTKSGTVSFMVDPKEVSTQQGDKLQAAKGFTFFTENLKETKDFAVGASYEISFTEKQ